MKEAVSWHYSLIDLLLSFGAEHPYIDKMFEVPVFQCFRNKSGIVIILLFKNFSNFALIYYLKNFIKSPLSFWHSSCSQVAAVFRSKVCGQGIWTLRWSCNKENLSWNCTELNPNFNPGCINCSLNRAVCFNTSANIRQTLAKHCKLWIVEVVNSNFRHYE